VPNDSHTLTGFVLTVISSISPVKTQDQHIPSAYNTGNKINYQKKKRRRKNQQSVVVLFDLFSKK